MTRSTRQVLDDRLRLRECDLEAAYAKELHEHARFAEQKTLRICASWMQFQLPGNSFLHPAEHVKNEFVTRAHRIVPQGIFYAPHSGIWP